jgi:virulence factor
MRYSSSPFLKSRRRMLRLGILDFDSSHCVEFSRRLNHVQMPAEQFVEGARVVAGWPGESEMAPERIAGFTPPLKDCGVRIEADADAVLRDVDAVLVLSLCGKSHRRHAEQALTHKRPVFIDKPFACTYEDAEAILTAANHAAIPVHYASAMRFCDELLSAQSNWSRWGKLLGATCYGPARRHPPNPGFFHYGIHSVEVLYTLLGPGCQMVTCHVGEHHDIVTGRWQDGRVGTFQGLRAGHTAYGVVLFCENGVIPLSLSATNSYRNLLRALVPALKSSTPLTPYEVILEETAFVLAALESERRDGAPVRLSEVCSHPHSGFERQTAM